MQLKVPARHSVLLVYYMLPPVCTGALAHNNAYFGEGSGPIFIGRTQCSGSESSIAQCTYNTITQCSHSDDAGVTCSGKLYVTHNELFHLSLAVCRVLC